MQARCRARISERQIRAARASCEEIYESWSAEEEEGDGEAACLRARKESRLM